MAKKRPVIHKLWYRWSLTHKRGDSHAVALCSWDSMELERTSEDWSKVTCLNCLKKKPKGKP